MSEPLSAARRPLLVISCEHGGNEVPGPYAPLFAGLEAQLESHRGWDPGALQLARQLAAALNAPLHAATTSRLLVDLNRSIGHPHLFSEATRPLPRAERNAIVDRYYRPHREHVEGEIGRRIASGSRVIHVASHSFTPTLQGEERRADVAWLYDPRRAGERAFARDWMTAFARLRPDLRVRRNYPYRGRDDGLTALLRRRHPDECYVGVELEVNQRFVERGGAPWEELRAQLVEALATVMLDASGDNFGDSDHCAGTSPR
ncbi:N-formylglutamate amidohydrolase [Quisquiliibacterium transsilvanicum]|uniref:N-formylglutamate amidohydrolase n=1 Tax=Quisquiliibacterium transsilvanicum TaxID=1549638 RepID=UPI0031B5B34F